MIERERYRFTAKDYKDMAKAGVMDGVRAELIDGDFIVMAPLAPPHAGTVDWLAQKLVMRLGESVIVRVQGPILIDEYNVPQPDISVLRVRADFYKSSQPQPSDVLLLIEVADSTVRSDRYVKVPKYGAAGIPETWLVDLQHGLVLVHTDPQADGYGAVKTLKPGETARPLAFPNVELSIAELLG